MLEMAGVGKLVTPVPLARTVPPLGEEYQSMVSPGPTLAVKVRVPVPHLVKGPVLAVGALGEGLTVAITLVLLLDKHPPAVSFASA